MVLCVANPLKAAGVLYPATGFQLPPGIAAAFEAMSTILVIGSSILLNFYRKPSLVVEPTSTDQSFSESAPLLVTSVNE